MMGAQCGTALLPEKRTCPLSKGLGSERGCLAQFVMIRAYNSKILQTGERMKESNVFCQREIYHLPVFMNHIC